MEPEEAGGLLDFRPWPKAGSGWAKGWEEAGRYGVYRY